PPAFAPYQASFFVSGSGSVVSHDPHLNEDGEALYRFLLGHAATPPDFVLRCRGSHSETHTRLVTHRDNDGHTHHRSEHYTERVPDFDFAIDVGQNIVGEPIHWTMQDSTPASRGRMFLEVGIEDTKRRAKRSERKLAKAWQAERTGKGLPPWVAMDFTSDHANPSQPNTVFRSSWTLRQWADDYCTSQKYLKEFDYEKLVYGWNFDALKAAVRSTIFSTHYRGDISVDFETTAAHVSVRSDNPLSRALSKTWVKVILSLLLIYPFILLYRRYASHGGGRWAVCGGAYALKRMELIEPEPDTKAPLPAFQDDYMDEEPPAASSSQPFGGSSEGASRIVGLREGEWFRQWEGTIRRAVMNR
ncbi:hypothetical protein CONPUDRAFT_23890, partial [Coniophora puteana RWD-64-598 SS2]